MFRIGMLTSGGDCQALNAAMRGVVKGLCSKRNDVEIYGFQDGYKGLIYSNFEMLTAKDFSGILTMGGTILGTSRQPFKLMRVPGPDGIDKVEAMKHTYHKLNLNCLVILGGNGTHKTANLLREEGLNVITLPKTIDNDLIMTDHTPGFGSAAKYIASSIREIAYDTYIYDLESVNIIEIMGRDAGWLTAASVLARNEFSLAPHLIYLPEVAFDKEQFITDLKEMVKKYKNVIVAVSEGIRDKDGNYISATNAAADKFGHAQLSGAGKTLEYLVKEKLGIKVRSVEVNVLQRCAGHMASMTDLTESFLSGKHAVVLAKNGESAQMVSLHRLSNAPYTYELSNTPVSEVANQAKEVPVSWITPDHHDVTAEMIAYLKPLVAGEVPTDYADGIADYLDVSHLTKVYGK